MRLGQIFDHARMAPREQLVEVAEFLVELVISVRPYRDHGEHNARRSADDVREIANAFVAADAFAVLDAGGHQRSRDRRVGETTGDDERPEEIALATFIHAEVRREHLGIVDFLVAELRLAEHLGLEPERHEVLRAFALQHDLRALFVNGDGQLVLGRVVERVRFWLEAVAVGLEQRAQLVRLRRRERRGVKRERLRLGFDFGIWILE